MNRQKEQDIMARFMVNVPVRKIHSPDQLMLYMLKGVPKTLKQPYRDIIRATLTKLDWEEIFMSEDPDNV